MPQTRGLVDITWTDAVGAGWGVLIAVGVITLVIAIQVWDARRRKSPSVMIEVVGAVARMWVAITGLYIVVTIVGALTSPYTAISDLPVAVSWPTPLPCDLTREGDPYTAAGLDCASLRSADVTAVGIGAGTRVILAAGNVLGLVAIAVPGLVLAVICRGALRGAPFAPNTVRWLFAGALAVLLAGCGGALLSDLGAATAARDLLPAAGLPVPSGVASVTARGTVALAVPGWPIGVALGMAALGVVFRRGAQLQHETEGPI